MQARSRFSIAAGLLLVFVFLVTSAGPRGHVLAADPTPDPPHKLFLPFTSRTDTFTVQGSVADAQGQPLAGVVISDSAGRRALTEADGSYALAGLPQGPYALAAEHPSYVFSPGLLQGTLPNAGLNNFTAYQACVEALVNGGFETAAGWELPATQLTAAYSSAVVHSGQRALRTGVYATANLYSYSSGRQAVTIPAGTASALLRVWLYPFTTETPINAASALPEQPAAGLHVTDAESAILGSDVQYVLVLDAADNVLDTLLWIRSNSQQWTYYEFNLTKYAGLPIQIQVGTFNDGIGGATAMFADDLALQICDSGTAPTPPPTPACTNALGNSGFEFSGSWTIPITEFSAGYSTAQAHSGVQSMRTGIVSLSANRYSYSDAYQLATIPADATSARLSLWQLPFTSEAYTGLNGAAADLPPLPETTADPDAIPGAADAPAAWGEAELAGDVQYLLVLNRYGVILETLIWQKSNLGAWQYREFDLLRYRGQTIRLQFGTYNDGWGGVTSMYVDDMLLDICRSVTPPPVTPTPPTPTPPTPTPPPGSCSEAALNGNFESQVAWNIPITRFSAGYSTALAHTGVQSMRAGILYTAHNRFSYSDAYQTMYIPASAGRATLTLWENPQSEDVSLANMPAEPEAALDIETAQSGDVQYVLLLDSWGNWIDTLLWQRKDHQTWTPHTWDLTRYRGMNVRVQFGVYNDGLGGVSAMFVDDVSLQVCP